MELFIESELRLISQIGADLLRRPSIPGRNGVYGGVWGNKWMAGAICRFMMTC